MLVLDAGLKIFSKFIKIFKKCVTPGKYKKENYYYKYIIILSAK